MCFHLLNLLYDSLTDMAIYSLCPLVPGFPCSSAGKESACNAGDPGSILGLGRSLGGGHGNPFQYSCLENSHGQRSLVGRSPRGCNVLDMIKQLSTSHQASQLSFELYISIPILLLDALGLGSRSRFKLTLSFITLGI